MRKKIFSILFMGIIILGLTGCGKSTEEGNLKSKTNETSDSGVSEKNKDVKNGIIHCDSPYSSTEMGEYEETTVKDGKMIAHYIFESNYYETEDEYKKKCQEEKGKEDPNGWEYYENNKIDCYDEKRIITETRTFSGDELKKVFAYYTYTKDDGTFDSKSYIEFREGQKYTCIIK